MATQRLCPESAILEAGRTGTAKICAAFGGQGFNNLHCFNDLLELNKTYGSELRDLINIAASTLSELALIPHNSGFHENLGFDLQAWLAEPASAPDEQCLALSPISFPINTLLSLSHYSIACHLLGQDPGQLRSSLRCAVGHSQGIFAAAAIAKSDSWDTFYEAAHIVLRLSFWVGLESHHAAPPSAISAAAAEDCIEHGEGQPSSMLSISGLNRYQITLLIDKVNKGLSKSGGMVHLALINSRDKYVLGGCPQSLRAVCLHLRGMKSVDGSDQTRVIFNKRKPNVTIQFLPISAPYHSSHLSQVESCVNRAISSISLTGYDLAIPLYHTGKGENLQDYRSQDLISVLVRAVTVEMVDWPNVCAVLDATHILDFGPGQLGSLTHETTNGTGLRVIQIIDRPSRSKSIGVRAELFSSSMPPLAANWKHMFGPKLIAGPDGIVRMETKMTRILGTPPVMIAGMTPTTVSWDFVATVMQAGYHIELAGGGYSDKSKFKTALRSLASSIPKHLGITCNLLYANPETIAWQTSLLRTLIREGIPITGITIGAGIPSHDVVKEYIETIGIEHISFKPGSSESIEKVIDIAQLYPDFTIGLQWTGGRAGGHHSFEDFHLPILQTYGRIRECQNIILIAGSGFGGASDTFPYLCGEWSTSYGYPPMPFDGVLLGSRMMVSQEAHTSHQAKKLIIEAEGVCDANWWKTMEEPTGGVLTINSEMGHPIHMLATRGVILWKEFDQQIFSIRDPEQRLKYLHLHRDDIVARLNKDFVRPWFAVNQHEQNVDIQDMTYGEILQRLCQLLYVHHENRWIDMSYRILVQDFIRLVQERFGRHIESTSERPIDIVSIFEGTLGSDAREIIFPEDVSLLMSLFRRRGQKPVPFIPMLDQNFETWFKKDSLWQSEDVEAVFDQDVQRVCVIQGPVAARYSVSCEEPAQVILDNICEQHVRMLQKEREIGPPNANLVVQEENSPSELPAVNIQKSQLARKYEFIGDNLPETDLLIEHIVGPAHSWARSCLMERWIYKSKRRVKNPIRASFVPQTGDVVEVRLAKDSSLQEIAFIPGHLTKEADSYTVLRLACIDNRYVRVTITPPSPLSSRRLRTQFEFELYQGNVGFTLQEHTSGHNERIKDMYSHLWTGGSLYTPNLAGLSSQFSGDDVVLSEQGVQEYMNVIRRTSPPQLQAWNPRGSVPLDFLVVVSWTALTKPLMIPSLDCDLLQLLHRSMSFKYLPSKAPFKIGDVVRTVSRISSLTIQPTGKLIEVSANIWRHGEPILAIKSDFFIQGTFTDRENQFTSIEEPEMNLNIQSKVLRALLLSRKWFIFENPSTDIMGQKLIFRLTTLTMYNHEGSIALIQVSGTVTVADHDITPTRLGRVYFEEDTYDGNPVMDFLRRHGDVRFSRQALACPGWRDNPKIFVRAPAQSAPYAKVSRDTNPIHVCPVFARYAGHSGTVIHGMQTSAIIRRVVEWSVGDTDRSRFKRWYVAFEGMVRRNDLLRVELEHIAMEEGRMVFKVRAFNDLTDDKVIEAEAEIEQTRTGYMFCGQGSQEKGMGMSLYNNTAEARALWDRGDAFLRDNYGFSLLHIVRENPQKLTISFGGKRGRRIRSNYLAMSTKSQLQGTETHEQPILKGLTSKSTSYTFSYLKGLLMSTQFSQPALALMEMAEYEHLKAKGVIQSGALFAGHSLGEYAALGSCSTFMSFENLLTLIFYRGLRMQNSLPRNDQGRTNYSMMAADPSRVGKEFDQCAFQSVIGLISQEMKLLLEVVNHNVRSQQYVCAGHVQSLWVLGKTCDEISCHPQPHVITEHNLLEIIRRHISAAEQLSGDITLERGKATIPLEGIDIPFHSTMLRGEIEYYRNYLLSKLNVGDIKPNELVGRWIPNVVGKPFSLDRSYIALTQRITGSQPLQHLLDVME